MPHVSLPVDRPTSRALVVATASNALGIVEPLERLHAFECTAVDDPYAAMIELSRHPGRYSAVVLSLAGVYREELALISAAKRRDPRIELWLAQTDARQAMLVEAIRLGADGLLAEDGLHRVAPPGTADEGAPPVRPAPANLASAVESPEPADEWSVERSPSEPVLTAEELRALLQDQPAMPPFGAAEHTPG